MVPDLLLRWYEGGCMTQVLHNNEQQAQKSLSLKRNTYLQFNLVISDEAQRQLEALERLARDMISFANAPGMNANKCSKEKWYLEFSLWLELDSFHADEWRLVLYATYLSLSVQSVETIKAYCSTVCKLNELEGYPVINRGKLYRQAIQGIRHLLQHETQHAQPITIDMLNRMVNVVDVSDEKQLATWVTVLVGFFMYL